MNAAEARVLSEQQLSGALIDTYLYNIHTKIRHAAECGRVSIVNPWFGLNVPDGRVQEAVFNRLRSEGYKVTHHPDPDPGHPASIAYDEISW